MKSFKLLLYTKIWVVLKICKIDLRAFLVVLDNCVLVGNNISSMASETAGLEPVLSHTEKSCLASRITDNFPRILK